MVRIIGVTGNVASGKSLLCAIFSRALHVPVFSADASVRQLCADDATVIEQVASVLPNVIADRKVDRVALGKAMVAQKTEFALAQKYIIAGVLNQLIGFVSARSLLPMVIAEIPLLFELNWDIWCDATISVFSSVAQRQSRFGARVNNLGVFAHYEKAQMLPNDKALRADYLIINNLSKAELYLQARRITDSIKSKTPLFRANSMAFGRMGANVLARRHIHKVMPTIRMAAQ